MTGQIVKSDSKFQSSQIWIIEAIISENAARYFS